MDPSLTALRVLRAVAERGTFTAAAAELGYTQSAISRQIAALEKETGATLVDRLPGGVRLTTSGLIVLRHARVVLDEIAATRRELDGVEPDVRHVRLGAYPSAGAVLIPRTVRGLRESRPDIRLTTREAATPALIRALRAGTLDVAVISSRPPYRPPDGEMPALITRVIDETDLMIAVSSHGRFAGRTVVDVEELDGVDWIVSPSAGDERLMGVWPGLAGRPRVAHTARDWMTKLRLVAADCGVTTAPPDFAELRLDGVQLMRVTGGMAERRRALAAWLPGPDPVVAAVVDALRSGDRPRTR